MKRRNKLVLTVAIAVMLVCLMSVAAFADDTVPQFEVYTAIGDSNPAGFGLDAYFENAGGLIKEGDLIEGSYPALVANAVGAEKVNTCTHSGWRTTELLRAIDPEGYTDTDGSGNYFWRALNYESLATTNALAAKLVPAIEEADIITLHYGSNDIFTNSVKNVYDDIADLLDEMDFEVPENVDPETFINLVFDAAEKAGILTEAVAGFVDYMDANTETFKANMVTVLDKVTALNPDAQIYVVGVINSLNMGVTCSNGELVSLIGITDVRLALVNQYLKELCANYENCVYVDAPNTEMFGIGVLDVQALMDEGNDGLISALKIVHPTEKGHQYIANQIVSAIKDNNEKAPTVTVMKSVILKKNIVKWNEIEGAVIYRVYRSTSVDGVYTYAGSTIFENFYDLLGSSQTTYYYKVCAVMSLSSGVSTPMSEPVKA